MRSRAALIVAMFLLPSSVFAASTFGFPREPLWLSSTSAHEGEVITMYVALYNASDTEMKGTVSYLADGAAFDAKDVSLAPGNSSLVSSGWKSVKGAHALSAQFVSGDTKDTTQKISVSVDAAPPPPPAAPSMVDQAVQTVQNFTAPILASDSPVGNVAGAAIDKVEAVRTASADAIRPYAEPAKTLPKNSPSGSTFVATASGGSIIDTITHFLASALLFAFDTAWLFYLLAIVLLYLFIRLLKRWVNRPRF